MIRPLKIPLLLFLLYAFQVIASAQEIEISQPEKFFFRSGNLEILGKAQGLVYLHTSENRNHYLSAFGSGMGLKWKRNLGITDKQIDFEYISLSQNGIVLYFSQREKNTRYLYARKYNYELVPADDDILIDSFKRSFGDRFPEFNFKESENKKFTMVFLIDEELNRNDNFQFVLVNDSLHPVLSNKISLPTAEKRSVYEDILVDNQGEIYIVIGDYKDIGAVHANRYWILSAKNQYSKSENMKIDPGNDLFLNNTKFKVDNVNQNLVIAGFYAEDFKRDASAEGIYIQILDLSTDSTLVQKTENFSPEFIARIKGTKRTKRADRLYTFVIDDIILRKDGGAIIMSESYYRTYRSTTNMYDPYGFPSFNESNVSYHYDEILVLSVHPQGEMHWKNILPKSQTSSGDKGRYSSYCMMNTGYNLVFIINDQVISRTNVIQYNLDGAGNNRREVIFNSKNQDVYLMPQLAKQVSSQEIVIPSIKRNKLRLVKLIY